MCSTFCEEEDNCQQAWFDLVLEDLLAMLRSAWDVQICRFADLQIRLQWIADVVDHSRGLRQALVFHSYGHNSGLKYRWRMGMLDPGIFSGCQTPV